jgi:hypothetical protein
MSHFKKDDLKYAEKLIKYILEKKEVIEPTEIIIGSAYQSPYSDNITINCVTLHNNDEIKSYIDETLDYIISFSGMENEELKRNVPNGWGGPQIKWQQFTPDRLQEILKKDIKNLSSEQITAITRIILDEA